MLRSEIIGTFEGQISRTCKCNKSTSFCIISCYDRHKMPLNAKQISVHQDLWQINHFSDIILVDEDTKKPHKKTIENYSSPKYPVKLRFLIFP